MSRRFRVYPAFGVARVGDSSEPGFVGPEIPGVPANWRFDTGGFAKFKDSHGLILRQGVRFRVFEFDSTGALLGEVLAGQGDTLAIEWTVHVSNRKAEFFQFNGSQGEDGDFTHNGLRNSVVQGDQRASLRIDPGPKTISGCSAGPVPLVNANPATSSAIPDLGDISTDDVGRLLFFGGHGKTFQASGAPGIQDYVNNDGWFDDVSDGPISAAVVLRDGTRTAATGAWVSVGPPDFAPAIANVVSLYDTMWDVAVRAAGLPIPALAAFRGGGVLQNLKLQRADWDPVANRFKKFRPSFVNDIADLFQRAFSATFVHAPPDVGVFHNTIAPQMWSLLADPGPTSASLRADVFNRMRDPNVDAGANSALMPRGLGDEYCDEDLFGPSAPERGNSRRFFSLTRIQYAMLAQWKDGLFLVDGDRPKTIPSSPEAITPEGLDRAVLENCVGGPFYPGIEVSWLVRNPKAYVEPFRIGTGLAVAEGVETTAGFFTQQMALPWQADFRDCKRESLTNTSTGTVSYAMWWAGQRPDDVFPEDDADHQVPWTRAPHFLAGDGEPARFAEMVSNWSTLGFVARRSDDKKKWLETERK